jgi:hypothetical protein
MYSKKLEYHGQADAGFDRHDHDNVRGRTTGEAPINETAKVKIIEVWSKDFIPRAAPIRNGSRPDRLPVVVFSKTPSGESGK